MNSENGFRPASSLAQRATAFAFPLFLVVSLLVGIRWALVGPYGLEKSVAILFVSSVALLFAAYAMGEWVFGGRAVLPFYAGVAVVWLGWAWQRLEYTRQIPNHFLQYGYFASPAGKHARLLVLELPFSCTMLSLGILFCLHGIFVWRTQRWKALILLLWWPVAGLIFSLPSLYLELQGDAAIFI